MKEIDEDTQMMIAQLYQKTRMSVGSIAKALNISTRTVDRYKRKWISQKRL